MKYFFNIILIIVLTSGCSDTKYVGPYSNDISRLTLRKNHTFYYVIDSRPAQVDIKGRWAVFGDSLSLFLLEEDSLEQGIYDPIVYTYDSTETTLENKDSLLLKSDSITQNKEVQISEEDFANMKFVNHWYISLERFGSFSINRKEIKTT
jgi:hypothetical protein